MDFIQGGKRQGYRPTGLKALLSQIQNKAKESGEEAVAGLIRECMANGWQGIIWDRLEKQGKKAAKQSGASYDLGELERRSYLKTPKL